MHCPSDQAAEDGCEQHPVLHSQVKRQGEEEKTDVLAVNRITLGKGNLKQKAQDYVPAAHLYGGGQKPEDAGSGRNQDREMTPCVLRKVGGRWRVEHGLPLEGE